jgi:hypothetical protein
MFPTQFRLLQVSSGRVQGARIFIILSKIKLADMEIMQEDPNPKADNQDSTLRICNHVFSAVRHTFKPFDEVFKPIAVGMELAR